MRNRARGVRPLIAAGLSVAVAVTSGVVSVTMPPTLVSAESPAPIAVSRPQVTVCRVAGTGRPFDVFTPSAASLPINQPTELVADAAGNVYFYDEGNGLVRRVDTAGAVSVVAGDPTGPFGRDDLAATGNNLNGLADIELSADGATLWLLESGVIRAVDLATGDISTIAGIRDNISLPVPTNGGPALGQGLGTAVGLARSGDDLYVLTGGWIGEPRTAGRVMRIDLASGAIERFGGEVDGFTADENSDTLDTVPVSAAGLYFIAASEIETNPATGELYVMSNLGRILAFDPATGRVRRAAGGPIGDSDSGDDGTRDDARFPPAAGFAFRGADLFVAQTQADRLRRLNLIDDSVEQFAGGTAGFAGDGSTVVPPATEARFAMPSDITADAAGNLYVADTQNHRIRRISASNELSTIAGQGGPIAGQEAGDATNLSLQDIGGIAADDAGGYFVADNVQHRIFYADPNNKWHYFAGSGSQHFAGEPWSSQPAVEYDLGSASGGTGYVGNLRFVIVGGQRYLYFFEGWDPTGATRLVRIAIDESSQPVTTIIGDGRGGVLVENGIAADQGGVYSNYAVAANGDVYLGHARGGQIFRVSAATGRVTQWAGASTVEGDFDVTTGGGNRLAEKVGLVTAIDVAANGLVYFASQNPNANGTRVFKVGDDDNVALIGGAPANNDIVAADGGLAVGAPLWVSDIRVDTSGQAYLKEPSTVRRIDPADGRLYRVVGNYDGAIDDTQHSFGNQPQPALSARVDALSQFDVAADGTLLLAEDYRNSGDIGYFSVLPFAGANRVRRVVPSGACDETTPVPSATAESMINVGVTAWDQSRGVDVGLVTATPDLSHIVYTARHAPGLGVGGRRGLWNVYLYDRGTGATQVVNLRQDGLPDERGVFDSLDQRPGTAGVTVDRLTGHVLVGFSTFGQLLPSDTDAASDVYVRDMTTGALTLASTTSSAPFVGNTTFAAFVPGGQKVAFTNRTAEAGFDAFQTLVRDLPGSLVQRLGQASQFVGEASFSDNGQYAVFTTQSVLQQGAGSAVARQNIATGEIEVLSGAAAPGVLSNSGRISADGRTVVFARITTGGAGDTIDLRLWTEGQGTVGLDDRTGGPTGSWFSVDDLSSDGRRVLVRETLGADTANRLWAYDRTARLWTPIDVAPGQTTSVADYDIRNVQLFGPLSAFDDGGRRIAFASGNDIGLPRSANGVPQVYLRDLHSVTPPPAGLSRRAAVPLAAPPAGPDQVRVQGDGSLVYWDGGELYRRSPGGGAAQLTTSAGGPHLLAVTDAGDVYYGVRSTGVIFQVQATGAPVRVGAMAENTLTGLAVNSVDGQLYATAGNAVWRVAASASGPPAGTVIAGEPDVTVCGAPMGPASATPFCQLAGIDVDANGSIVVVDQYAGLGASRSRIIGISGGYSRVMGGIVTAAPAGAYEDGVDARSTSISVVSDIAAHSDGSVYLVERDRARIRRIGPDGIIHTVLGGGAAGDANAPAPALSGFPAVATVDVQQRNGDLVYGTGQNHVGMVVGLTTDLSASNNGVVEPGVSVVPTRHIPSAAIEPPPAEADELTVEAVSLSDIDLQQPLDDSLQASPLRNIPLRNIPLRNIGVASAPLRNILLSSVPVDVEGGWAALLADTPLAGKPLQAVSLDDALNPALNTNLDALLDLPLTALDLSSTPLRNIALASVALGGTPLRNIPLPPDVVGTLPGDPVLSQWCALLQANGVDCASLGIDPGNAAASAGATLLAVTLAGVPLRNIPLRNIPLRNIDLSASPLRNIPLRNINLSASPLRNIPLRNIELAPSPLRNIPLRNIPLRNIDIAASPLRSIPLRNIAGASAVVDCSRVDCTAGGNATLADAAALSPSAILQTDSSGNQVTIESLVRALSDADIAGFVLGDLGEFGSATVGDLLDTIPPGAEFTLGDLLLALIPIDDYPWENVDLDSTADLREAAVTPGAGGAAGPVVTYGAETNVFSVLGDGYSLAVEAQLALPPGFGFVRGSARINRSSEPLPIVLADPLNMRPADRVMRFAIDELQPGDYLTFDVVPGLELASQTVTLTLLGAPVPASASATIGTRVDGEWEEPNDTFVDARAIAADNIYIGHLPSTTDVDIFKIAVQEGQVMSAIVSNLPADYDLTLYAPAPAALAGRTGERVLVPVQDEPTGLSNDATAAPADPADDLLTGGGLVYAVGQRRDTGDERIDTGRLRAGTYYLQVTGFNGAASTKPYALRVTLQTDPSAVPPCATWSFVGDGANRGALPVPGAYAGVNTIFLVNRERLFGKHPSQAAGVMSSLSSFVAATNADAALAVRALVVPLDGDAAVRAAYQNWEAGANRCDPLVARGVSSAIAAFLDSVLAANPQIRNVVIVGGDDIVPFGRVPDTTRLANEREFAQELAGNDELVASLRGGWVLTDDVYVDRAPITVGTAELYVPNLALGRLVESPADIVAALNDFVAYQGHLDARTALSVGYDFLTDGANAVQSALVTNGFTTDTNAAVLIGDTWNAGQLQAALLGQNGFAVPDIASVNAHYDDYRSLPADENTNNSQTNLFTTGNLPATRTLARSLLFSVGCHGGLNVPDTTQASRANDWAQSYSRQGAVWLGNTGFGYGDTEVVAASEKLMAQFAQELNGQYTIGQALLLAKQGYVADLGDVVTAYDIKVSQQMTFYGLPMYRLQATSTPPDPAPPAPAVTNDVRVGLDAAPLSIVTPVGAGPGALEQRIEDRGTYYTVDGDALTVQNRPIQPRTARDATRVSSTGSSLGTATGMLVTRLVSLDQPGVNPAVFRPIVDSSDETEPLTSETVFPAAPVSIGSYTDLVGIGGQTVPIQRQQVVAIPGQFRVDGSGVTGTQRLFTEIGGVVYYAPAGDTDRSAPTIGHVDAVINGATATFTVRADDQGDASRVTRVYVLALPSNSGSAPATWVGVDLAKTGADTWTGGVAVPAGTTSADFLVQAVDASGNVGVSSNKGALYQTETPPAPQPDAPTVTFSPQPAASGWVGGAATVTASDPRSLPMSYSVDGGPNVSYTGPFTVTGAGAHEVVVRNTAGLRTVIRVPIDGSGPVADCADPPSTWSGADVSISCVATDAGAGLTAAADGAFTLTTAVADDTETANASTGVRELCDVLGLCTTAGPVTGLKVDRKAPAVVLTSPANGAVYDQGQVVNAAFSCADGGSGVTTCSGTAASGAAIDTASAGAKTFVVSTSDAVGNISSRAVSYTVRDGAPPVITCSAVPLAWSAANVTISCAAADNSGLANPSDASFALTTNVAAGVETATATTPSRTVCDTSGNCATAGPFGGIKVDRRAPVITVTAPVNGAAYLPGQVVNAAFTCNEGGSGEVSCTGTVANGAAINTAAPGAKTFTVTSADAVGNSATTTINYSVTAINSAPVVAADMGVAGLQEIGFQTGLVVVSGSFADADGPGPYTASVRWAAGGSFTPLILNNASRFLAGWLYATPGTRTVTVRICDANGNCGSDDITVRSSVTQRVAPTRCVIDRSAAQTPRYQARFGYNNPASFPIYVPTVAGLENTFTSNPVSRGQPQVFQPGAQPNAFTVGFSTGTVSWRLNGVTVSASSSSPRC